MTFDARGGKGPAISSNALFACAVFAVVGGAFLAVLNFPAPSEKAGTPQSIIAAADTEPSRTQHGLSSKPATYYFETLARLDPSAAAKLQSRLGQAGGKAGMDPANIVLMHGAAMLKERATDLAHANTSHVDDILVMTRDRLKSASRAGNIWCDGNQYADLDESALRDPAAFEQTFARLEGPLQDYSYELMAHLLLAADDAARNPVTRGPVTHADKAALQGVVMSMLSDPQVVPLIMAAQTSADPDELRRKLNMCELGATAMTALKTLPQDTKGRVFADLVKQLAEGNADLAGLTHY
jgi:hypothetical protein